jgi:hypothetical protein
MNVLFTHTFRAANGWRWRLEIHTADLAPLASPTVIELPENCIIKESLKWECKFADAPFGMTDTPKFAVSFNLAALQGTPELVHLCGRLKFPFVLAQAPPVIIPGYTETQYIWEQDPQDPNTGTWVPTPVAIPAQTIQAEIKEYKLTNFLVVRSDKGESALAAGDFYYMFTGCQGFSPTVKYGNFKQPNFLRYDAEFFHSARYVLEQINADMMALELQKYAGVRKRHVLNVKFDDVPKEVRFFDVPKDVDNDYAGMVFYTIFDFNTALEQLAKTIAEKIERKSLSGVTLAYGGIAFAKWNTSSLVDFSPVPLGNTANVYFLGTVYEPPNWTKRGGLLDKGSELYKRETMFDVVKDSCEAGCIARYGVFTSWHTNPMRGVDSGVTATENTIELLDGEGGAVWLRGVELAMQNIANIRYTNTGAAMANTDWALNLFWHNGTSESDGEKEEKDFIDQVVSQKYNTTKLYALSGAEMIAVHPTCGFDNGKSIVTTPTVNKTTPNDLTGVLRRDWKWGKPEYDAVVRNWTETTGLHTLVANEILAMYGNYEQMKIKAKTANAIALRDYLPLSVGLVFQFEAGKAGTQTGLFPAYAPQPNKAFLSSSVLDVFKGVAELEFFAPKAGIL